MQQLTCADCGTTWEREPKRGRPPTRCDSCKAGKTRVRAAEKPQEKPKVKRKAKAPAKAQENSKTPKNLQPLFAGSKGDLVGTMPFASRTSGWCTDYDPAPVAVHDRCDGDLGKYRCPCECHDWS